jgi:hypothetical protein
MDWDQAVAISLVHQNSVPSVQMHRRITAILRAMATRARLEKQEYDAELSEKFDGALARNPTGATWADQYSKH